MDCREKDGGCLFCDDPIERFPDGGGQDSNDFSCWGLVTNSIRGCLGFDVFCIQNRVHLGLEMSSDLFPAQSSFWGPFPDTVCVATLRLGTYRPPRPLASLCPPSDLQSPAVMGMIATPGDTGSNGEDSFVQGSRGFRSSSMSCN